MKRYLLVLPLLMCAPALAQGPQQGPTALPAKPPATIYTEKMAEATAQQMQKNWMAAYVAASAAVKALGPDDVRTLAALKKLVDVSQGWGYFGAITPSYDQLLKSPLLPPAEKIAYQVRYLNWLHDWIDRDTYEVPTKERDTAKALVTELLANTALTPQQRVQVLKAAMHTYINGEFDKRLDLMQELGNSETLPLAERVDVLYRMHDLNSTSKSLSRFKRGMNARLAMSQLATNAPKEFKMEAMYKYILAMRVNTWRSLDRATDAEKAKAARDEIVTLANDATKPVEVRYEAFRVLGTPADLEAAAALPVKPSSRDELRLVLATQKKLAAEKYKILQSIWDAPDASPRMKGRALKEAQYLIVNEADRNHMLSRLWRSTEVSWNTRATALTSLLRSKSPTDALASLEAGKTINFWPSPNNGITYWENVARNHAGLNQWDKVNLAFKSALPMAKVNNTFAIQWANGLDAVFKDAVAKSQYDAALNLATLYNDLGTSSGQYQLRRAYIFRAQQNKEKVKEAVDLALKDPYLSAADKQVANSLLLP